VNARSYDLLDKNELKFTGVELAGADLNVVAATVAEVLSLARNEVLVTDYLDHVLTLDILRADIYPHQLLDREKSLLQRLSQVPGVTLAADCAVTSAGMLGWIAADPAQAASAIRQAESMVSDINARISRRVMLFSTGAELVSGEVKDTNRATLADGLSDDGYSCDHGGALRDDVDLIAGAIRTAIGNGYGLVITTGGVGAEAKDRTVEAVQKLDPSAHTPYLCRFEAGHGRHVKDGVRIAVGEYRGSRIIALPGPNDEVAAALAVLRPGLLDGHPSATLADDIAEVLREILRARMRHHGRPDHERPDRHHPDHH
jgi:molybdenum cofactor synthesis domain-containing protein